MTNSARVHGNERNGSPRAALKGRKHQVEVEIRRASPTSFINRIPIPETSENTFTVRPSHREDGSRGPDSLKLVNSQSITNPG